MSELKVDKITPRLGTTLTLGDTGDTINFGSGVLPNFENLTVTGDLTVDTNSLKVDSTNNFVGIGTASPSSPLTINRSIDGDLIEFETSGTIVAKISSASGRALVFDADPVPGGAVATTMQFRVDNSEAMRIDSSGNILIGKTSGGSGNDGVQFEQIGRGGFTVDNAYTAFFNRKTSDGEVVQIRKDGTTVGTIGSNGAGTIDFNGTTTSTFSIGGTNQLVLHDGRFRPAADNDVDLGQTVATGGNDRKFKDIYLSGQTFSTGHFLTGDAFLWNTENNNIRFATNNTERMRIDSSGNVGIGTSSPAFDLDVNGNVAATRFYVQSGGNAVDPMIRVETDTNTGFFFPAADTIAATTGGSERMRITSDGNVGIGTTNISHSAAYASLRLGTTGSIWAYTSSINGNMFMSENISSQGGTYIRSDFATSYRQGDGDHRWLYAPSGSAGATVTLSEAMRIDTSGNLLVGVTSTSIPGVGNTTLGASLRNNGGGSIAVSRDGDNSGYFNRNTSDGSIVQFRKDGGLVGSIGAESGDLYIGTGDVGIRFNDGGNNIFAINTTDGNTLDNHTDLGASGGRWKDLYLGGSVYLGGTGAANALDDYEEGTWTGTLTGSSSNPGTLVTSTGVYKKIGSLVHIQIGFENYNGSGYSGQGNVGGLPFTNTSNSRVMLSVGAFNSLSWTDTLTAVISQSGTSFDFFDVRSGNSWLGANLSSGAGNYIWVTGTYSQA